jgi:uncharacterized protein DUF4328
MTQPPGGSEPLMPYNPGQQPPPYYGGQVPPRPVYAQPVQSLNGLALATSILLGVAAALAAVNALPLFNRAKLAGEFLGGGVTLSRLNNADSAVAGLYLLLLAVILATGIVFVIWQYRHAANAVALGGRLGLGPGWAIGGWFIPLANFVLPTLQIRQSARASGRPVPGVVAAWTTTYVIANVAYFGANGIRPDFPTAGANAADFIDKFVQADRVAASGSIIYAVAGVLAIVMVRTLSKNQEQAVAQRAQQQPTYDPYG